MKRQMARALSGVLAVWKILEEMAASAGSRTGYYSADTLRGVRSASSGDY